MEANFELHQTKVKNKIYEQDNDQRSSPKIKISQNIDEIYEHFDSDDSESNKVQFVVKEPKTWLPPIPDQNEISTYLIKNALLLVDCGEYRLAQNVLADILRRDSNNIEAIRWMGWCFKQLGNYENALQCYEQLVSRRNTEEDLFELGEIYYALKKFNEAYSTWFEALLATQEISSRTFDLHKNLGNVFVQMGDYDSAEENYNKALTIRSNSDVLFVNMGTLEFQRNQPQKAFEYFKRGVELNPYNDSAWCGIALVAKEYKDDEWARSALIHSLDLNPNNLIALHFLIKWDQEAARWDEAIEKIQKYLDKNQDDGDIIYSLAGLYYQKGQILEAEIELTRLHALQPDRADANELKKLIEIKKEQLEGTH